MTDLQPQESIVHPTDDGPGPEKMVHHVENSDGSDSPGGVDGLEPTATEIVADECKLVESESASVAERDDDEEDDDEEEDEEGEENNQDDAIEINELNAEQLLALSKSRLDKLPQARTTAEEESVDNDENEAEGESEDVASEGDAHADNNNNCTTKVEVESSPSNDTADEPAVKDQAYYIELAIKKAKESKTPSPQKKNIEAPSSPQKKIIEDPAYLHKLAERKVAEAEAKAKVDEERTGDNIIKPALLPAKPTRNENSELWALLNYSKARLETGATPTLGKKTGGSRGSSIRGADDTVSISSKLSKSSKRSQSSRLTAPVTVVGGPGDDAKADDDGPFPDVTDNGEAASVDGSVSLESATKNYSDANEDGDDDESDNSDNENNDDEDDSSEDEDEEEDLPDFLKDNDEEEIDPEEARELYEAAKFKAASILSVTKDHLTDVQMLQAIAIAEDAAKNGEDKFSTKRSLFKLNEAKVEDLKSLLSLSFTQTSTEQESVAPKARERYTGGWGIGGGRLMKKLGTVVQDFREKCEEIDAKKEQARVGQPTGKEILNAAMVDLRAQIEEYEKIVTKSGKR